MPGDGGGGVRRRATQLAQDIQAAATEAYGAMAVILAGNWRSSLVGSVTDTQAKGAGQRDQGHELAACAGNARGCFPD